MYAGVSSHLAPIQGRQDNHCEDTPADVVLDHIKDSSTTADRDRIRVPTYKADNQVFYTDAGDIVSLLAMSVAAEGGQTKWSRSWRVYNELAETRPDLIATLAGNWFAEKLVSVATVANPGPLMALLTRRKVSATPSSPVKRPLLHDMPASKDKEKRIIM